MVQEKKSTIATSSAQALIATSTSTGNQQTREANPRTPFSSTMSIEKFQDFLKEQGVMDADRIKMSGKSSQL